MLRNDIGSHQCYFFIDWNRKGAKHHQKTKSINQEMVPESYDAGITFAIRNIDCIYCWKCDVQAQNDAHFPGSSAGIDQSEA